MAVINRGPGGNSVYKIENNKPIPHRSVVSFVDILGYKVKVNQAAEKKKTESFLYDFRQELFSATAYLEENWPCYIFNFTDSVVIGWPIRKDSEVPLCMSCWNLAMYQTTMTYYGHFIRGGVSVGDAYFDDYIQSGEALVKAYEAESSRSVYPRIILTEEAVCELRKACGYYGYTDCSINRLFAVDSDGEIFINYLAGLFEIFDSEACKQDIEDYLLNHRKEIENNLVERKDEPSVYRKYQWAARYHDYFCDAISDWLQSDLNISIDYGRERFVSPRQLFDVSPDWLG